MNQFEWLDDVYDRLHEAGEFATADALDEVASHALARDYDAMEAAYLLLVGYARRNDAPWVEIYARHWRLQAYVTAGVKVREMLPEAVSLLALTARDEGRDCPQSRCAVQDLSICYGVIDGPGYAAERLAAIYEGVARVDPSWGCYACLMQEAVRALTAAGRPAEALQYGLDRMAQARDFGEALEESAHFWDVQVRELFDAALAANALDQAESLLARVAPTDQAGRVWKRFAQARLALAAGDAAVAATQLPLYVELSDGLGASRRPWLATALALVERGQLPCDAALEATARTVVEQCEADGQLRNAFEACCDAAAMALHVGRETVAREYFGEARRLRAELRGSHGADERMEALARRLAELTEPVGG